jgi:FixJ family two-component response regulator
MRVAPPIVLSEDVRRKLEQQSRGRSTQSRVVMRSRIVLLAAGGLQNKQIAATLNVAPRMAALWRGRFIEWGIEGLLKDAPRPGRTASISRASLIEKTTQSTPACVFRSMWAGDSIRCGHRILFGVGSDSVVMWAAFSVSP